MKGNSLFPHSFVGTETGKRVLSPNELSCDKETLNVERQREPKSQEMRVQMESGERKEKQWTEGIKEQTGIWKIDEGGLVWTDVKP